MGTAVNTVGARFKFMCPNLHFQKKKKKLFPLYQVGLLKCSLNVTYRALTNAVLGHLHCDQAKESNQVSFDTSVITLMHHILVQFWALTLLQALRDLPAGRNRGYLL